MNSWHCENCLCFIISFPLACYLFIFFGMPSIVKGTSWLKEENKNKTKQQQQLKTPDYRYLKPFLQKEGFTLQKRLMAEKWKVQKTIIKLKLINDPS